MPKAVHHGDGRESKPEEERVEVPRSSLDGACLGAAGANRPASVSDRPSRHLEAGDTHPAIYALQIQLYRGMDSARKAEIVEEEWLNLRSLALAGIRRRYPECPDGRLQEELHRVLLGPALAARIAAHRAGGGT